VRHRGSGVIDEQRKARSATRPGKRHFHCPSKRVKIVDQRQFLPVSGMQRAVVSARIPYRLSRPTCSISATWSTVYACNRRTIGRSCLSSRRRRRSWCVGARKQSLSLTEPDGLLKHRRSGSRAGRAGRRTPPCRTALTPRAAPQERWSGPLAARLGAVVAGGPHGPSAVLAQVPKGSAEMAAATIRTISAQFGPAQVREQLGVIAGMLGPPVPGSRRCSTTRPTTSPPSPRSPSGTGRRSGPQTPRAG
jgi:hypothetical protein